MAGITEVVSKTEGLKTLSEALIVSGIDEILSEEGPFTMFAPNVDAFSEIDTDTLVAMAADRDDLARILLSHVVRGRHTLVDLSDSSLLESLSGTDLWIWLGDEGGSFVDEARIIRGDVEVDNGVIHIIDRVLLPTDAAVDRGDAEGFAADRVFEAVSYTEFAPRVGREPFGECDEGTESVAI